MGRSRAATARPASTESSRKAGASTTSWNATANDGRRTPDTRTWPKPIARTGSYETSLVIDDNPGPHFVDQGDPFVTRHDLSGVDWEFDEGHCGYDGVQLSDDIARLAAAAMPVMESVRTESPIR